MPEVQSVKTTDYQMPVVQPQNQYMEPAAEEDMPMVYNPESTKHESHVMKYLGYLAISAALIAGGYYWGHSAGKKSGGDEDKLKETVQELYNDAKNVYNKYPWRKVQSKTTFIRDLLEKLKSFVKDVENDSKKAVKDCEK